MCGIAGFFNIPRNLTPERSILERMIVTLKHRGPDGYGLYYGNGVGLGHARLSIIDLSTGWQPLANEDRTLWIIFNGEIFNYPELRKELIGRGHVFATNSDTEVIIHLFEEKGWQCLEHLNGQFAIAIYDSRKDELFLARDRMGIRPLFYTLHNGNFYFASEIKALFNADPAIPRELDPRAISDIFTFWTPTLEETVFQNVHQLPAGHWLRVDKSGVHTPRRYWEMPLRPDVPGIISEAEYADELRELLIDSVRLRLRADVPVGAYLSGGLDSSTITSLIKNFTSNPLKTFSVSFADKVYDEKEEQQEMVRYLGTAHHEVACSYGDIAATFPQVIWHTEVPILRTAPSPLYLLSSLVRDNQYKVVLTGEGADEMLGGYDIFKEAKIRAFIHKNLDSSLRPLLLKRLYPYLALSPTRSAEYARKFFDTHADPGSLYYAHGPRWKTTGRTHVFLDERITRDISSPRERLANLADDLQGLDFFLGAQFLESKLLLGNYLLSSQGDRMAMAHSVEGRFPFLDHRVVEFAGRIPPQLKMKVLNEKNILKKAVQNLLPQHIVSRKKQPYMAPDILSFFEEQEAEYLDHYLSPHLLRESKIFKPEAVAGLMAKCRKKSRQGFRENMAFVGILSTQIIYDKFIKSFPFETPDELPHVKVRVNDTGSR
ncbi:asparagine synthase (glutamine-hydrolyzing) [Desulfopila inferna]|uniref:asparagine synthase (glutamine-hydrolyzing) n=1 Tax=Desulfopila inferna TaxID=468528 RepID=UPI00196330F0|nr:asparagine synthase (glutamine-hydrolyzing) [Desulfopila inferna]MBM9605737.1 asparagine synthase (glutamine-hydrolyzing) [Desulfopila inferna]